MSNYPNLPRTAWIVCVDVYYRDEGIPYTHTRRVFLDREQAHQYCEDYAAEHDFKWSSVTREWCSKWKRDGSLRQQWRMYLDDCRLEQPVAQEAQA